MSVLFQVREVSSAAVEAAAAIQEAQEKAGASAGAVGNTGVPPDMDSSIMERVKALLKPTFEVSE